MPEAGFEPACPEGQLILSQSRMPVPPLRLEQGEDSPAARDNRPVAADDQRLKTVGELCSFEGRLAGTDAERRAANDLAGRLRALGRRVDVEPTYVHPQAPLVWAAHCALALAGSLVIGGRAGRRVRARPARRNLPLPRPQHPPLPAPPPLLPPRIAERRLPRLEPDGSRPPPPRRPLRRRPHRDDPPAQARRPRPAAHPASCPSPTPASCSGPLAALLPHAGRAHGRRRRPTASRSCSSPPP